ncbi:hypothetical protein pneo_cds_753 [Pandoravirus neocaledonia]|uniref:Uncharacterized protein n=1 Tax=Pandoravirus neocaledonia TaxID=2107708 RepID=A0A2U7UDF5_9VIRU|nr:hypothetical protein pneo_cds_753 [Pandoravirus neocaledonia]AVK76360.1 hypothetical protein pneo_cds_753 [Pandoravirus neocaledonia]
MEIDSPTEAAPTQMSILADACVRRLAGRETPQDSEILQHYLENQPCTEMLPYYEALWASLEADPDAANAVRVYGWVKQWPPSRREVIDTYLDLIRLPNTERTRYRHRGRYSEALNEARDAPPEALVALLGAAERKRAAGYHQSRMAFAVHMANAARRGWSGFGGCASSKRMYLMTVLPVDLHTAVASLIAVPTETGSGDRPAVLGRIWNPRSAADRLMVPGDLPAPPVSALAPALQPFASVIPALLTQAAERPHRPAAKRAAEAEATRRYGKPLASRAPDVLLDRLAEIEALSVLPPEVTPYLPVIPSTYGTYAWFGECKLAAGLAMMFGRHAAAAAGPYAATVRAASVPAERDTDDDGDLLSGLRGPDRRRRAAVAPVGRTPNRLETLVRRTLARAPAASVVDAIPPMMQDDIGFDVWQGACSTPWANYIYSDPWSADRFGPLVAVARGWGVEPDGAELRRPELLCGRLARDAIMRGVRQGTRLMPDAPARTGLPTVGPWEATAIEAVCYDDRPNRPFERVDDPAIAVAVTKAFDFAYGRHPGQDDAALVDAATNLVTEANRLYGVPTGGERLHTVGAQAALAVLALRSGVRLEPADLSNAGRACAALTPTFALAP